MAFPSRIAGRQQLHMAARGALDLDEIAVAKIQLASCGVN
jgi:hypothetical protein